MSGSFQSRVNRYWECPTNSIAPAVFFWEWLNWINDHPGMVFKGYGTGKSASGVIPPSAWLDWDPWTVSTPPMSDNSWFVWEAENADALLDGNGTDPWQSKLQFTLATGFDDCNVADTDYDYEASTYLVCLRGSPGAGWDNVTTLDFSPSGSEAVSNNFRIFDEPLDGKFVLDLIGDDDTFWWKGACFDGTLSAEAKSRSRGGHIGMLQRRSSDILNPFFLMAGRINDAIAGTGGDAIFGCANSANYIFAPPSCVFDGTDRWKSFSLWTDKSANESHRHDSWDVDTRGRVAVSRATGDIVVLGILVGVENYTLNKTALLGEYRLIGSAGYEYSQHAVVGDDSNWIQIGYDVPTNPGILMRWPSEVSPIW